MTIWSRIALAAALFAAAVPFARAQEITATVTGTVTDESGAVLPGVTVTVRNIGTGFTKDVTTTGEGVYTAPLLPTGRYEVTFTLAGFQSATATNLNLHVNDRILLDMTLKTGGVSETIEVSAAAQMIQPMAAVQTLMGTTQVEELPLNNRNFVQLATLVPGVTSSLTDEVGLGLTANISISINGQRRNAVNWLVDGASNVDVGSNITLLNTPTLESIEEFKIITSSYAAEWPRSGGGIVNVVTKSGTNQFRASAYEFMRNDALNANSFIRKQTGCSADADGQVTCLDRSANGATDFAAIRNNPAELDYHNFGFTVGGPIKKDKLFFFYSQEWRRITRRRRTAPPSCPRSRGSPIPATPNYVAPADRDPNAVRLLPLWPAANVGTNLYLDSQPNEQDTRQEVVRVDYMMSPKWRFMGRYTHDLSETTEPGGLFFNTAIPNVATTLTDVPGQVFVGQVTTTLSSSTFNELSLQYSSNSIRSEYGENVTNTRDDLGVTISELFPENREGLIPFQVFPGGIASIGANQLFDNKYTNLTIAENLTHARGAHQWKGGFLIAMEAKDELSTSGTQGTFNWRAGGGRTAFQNFLTGNRDGLCGTNCDYVEPEREIASQFRWNRYEFYLQDTWSVSSSLRLDLGLRYSLQPGFTDENDLLTNFVPALFVPANAPQFANPAGTQLVVGSGDDLNGIVVAGVNSPHGRAVNNTDKNNLQPRVGFSYDVSGSGRPTGRAASGPTPTASGSARSCCSRRRSPPSATTTRGSSTSGRPSPISPPRRSRPSSSNGPASATTPAPATSTPAPKPWSSATAARSRRPRHELLTLPGHRPLHRRRHRRDHRRRARRGGRRQCRPRRRPLPRARRAGARRQGPGPRHRAGRRARACRRFRAGPDGPRRHHLRPAQRHLHALPARARLPRRQVRSAALSGEAAKRPIARPATATPSSCATPMATSTCRPAPRRACWRR